MARYRHSEMVTATEFGVAAEIVARHRRESTLRPDLSAFGVAEGQSWLWVHSPFGAAPFGVATFGVVASSSR